MATFKTKSLNPAYSDKDIETRCFSVSFLSFERAIKASLASEGHTGKEPVGYRVTEQGIEIIWE